MWDPLIDNDSIICLVCSTVAEDPVLADVSIFTSIRDQHELVCRGCRDDFLSDPAA